MASNELSIAEIYIGQAIREWANLEGSLFFQLQELMKIDQSRARILWMSLPNFAARRRLLERLSETYLDDAHLPEYRRLLRRLKNLADTRNALAHGQFLGTGVSGVYTVIYDKDDKSLGVDFSNERTFQLNNLKNFPNSIAQLNFDLSRFIFGTHVSPPERPKIHKLPKLHR